MKVIDANGILLVFCTSWLSASCTSPTEAPLGDVDAATDPPGVGEMDASLGDVDAAIDAPGVGEMDASHVDAVLSMPDVTAPSADASMDVALSADADAGVFDVWNDDATSPPDGFVPSADVSIDVVVTADASADADDSAPPGPTDASSRDVPDVLSDLPPLDPCNGALTASLEVRSVLRGTEDIVSRIVGPSVGTSPDITVTIEGERLSSCGSDAVLLPAHLFQTAGSVRGTINAHGACADVEIVVADGALPTLDSITPNTVPIDATTNVIFVGANLGVPVGYEQSVPAIVIGRDCAHERLYPTGTYGTFTILYNPPEAGSYYAYGIHNRFGDSVATSHRLPFTVTGVTPAPAIQSWDPAALTLAAEVHGGYLTLTAPTAFTAGMRIVAERDGVTSALPFCSGYVKTCAEWIPADFLRTPGNLRVRVQAYDGAQSNEITVPVVVATPVLDAVQPIQLTRYQPGTLSATGKGFTFGAAPEHRSRVRELTHGLEFDFVSLSSWHSAYVDLSVTPALTDTLGNLSFQIVNPDGATPRQSNVVNVAVVAGPWLSNNDSGITIYSSNPTLVLHGTGLDTPPQGGQPFAHFEGGPPSCPSTYDIVPTSVAESQWSLAIPQAFFTCAPSPADRARYEITVNIPGAPVSNASPVYFFVP